jgi:hypothetical protein
MAAALVFPPDTGEGRGMMDPSPRRDHRKKSIFIARAVRLLFLSAAMLLCGACSPAIGCKSGGGAESCTRILFLGNSYTFVNDLPKMFAELAGSGGHAVETGMSAYGGWTLTDHLNNYGTYRILDADDWNFVVLQEQSQIPAVRDWQESAMFPAARALAAKIRESGAALVFFMTWAHQDGYPEYGLPDYWSMQAEINSAYTRIAQELSAILAPVGYAWWVARLQDPPLDLWQADGSHPSRRGTYLAACVFYRAVFDESPVGLKYTAGIPSDAALLLQKIAADEV